MPTWPASLPVSPDAEGYSETAPFPVIQAPVDGPALTRRRYTAASTPMTARYLLDEAQLVIFEAFYKTDLKIGSLPFDGPSRGNAAVTKSFQFTGGYTLTRASDPYWLVSAPLIRLP